MAKKTSDLVNEINANLGGQFKLIESKGRMIVLEYLGDESAKGPWEVKVGNSGTEIWMGGEAKRFIMRSSDDGEQILKDIVKDCNRIVEINANRTVNKELCDYLTTELESKKFKIASKSGTPDCGLYTVEGPAKNRYLIKAAYTSDTANIFKILEDREEPEHIIDFNLSNPSVEKEIASYLADYDKPTLSSKDKGCLKAEILNWLAERLNGSLNYLKDTKNREFKCEIDGEGIATCTVASDSSISVKFRLKIDIKEA